MPLLLRIDNMDRLPDGGPVAFELDRRGIDIGRDPYLDWTLPDPERFISGKHCELRYRDGGYWLHDVSTNGTTINGRGGRLTEPYRLQDGDRVHIGHYIIAVELKGADAAPAPAAATPFAGGNVWGDVPDAAAAVDRRDFAARARAAAEPGTPRGPAELPEEDISWSIGELTGGAPAPDDPWDAPAGRDGPAGEAWGWTPPPAARPDDAAPRVPPVPPVPREAPSARGAPPPAVGPVDEAAPAAPRHPAAAPDATYAPDLSPDPDAAPRNPGRPAAPDPFLELESTAAPGGAPELAARSPGARPRDDASRDAPAGLASQWTGGAPPSSVPTRPTAGTAPAPAAARPQPGGGDFVAAFERGAGLPAGAVADRADSAFAEELGALFRLVTHHLQSMLLARAETKSVIRSAERTMIGLHENNPLKFSPSPEEAMRIMFGAKSRSYLDARATIEASFGDLQRHQIKTFAAMQQALQALVDDLDPKSIEAATPEDGGLAGIVASRRARLWDAYVERFRAKSGRQERGMVGAFMLLFAEMYDRQR